MRNIQSIVLHHTAIPDINVQYDIVHRSHKRKYGRGMEYHFFIERDGLTMPGMLVEEIGYHAGNWTVNKSSIGICLAGDFTTEVPTPQQIEAMVKLVKKMQSIYQISDKHIFLHREVRLRPTACPVIDLRDMVLARKGIDLEKRLRMAVNGLKWAKGMRRKRLLRMIQRIQHRLGLIDARDV
jgi:N-acetylmuramoyl-L-alanine amidase